MSEEARKYLELGENSLNRNEPEEALHWYERAIQEDPENPDAWCGRGKACYDLGRLERADRYFKRAISMASRRLPRTEGPRRWWADTSTRPYLRALHGRGLCRFWLGVYDDAAKLFEKLLKLAPTDPLDVRFLVGETYFRMGDLDRAIVELRKVGEDPDALYNLGLAHLYKGDFVASVDAFRRGFFENLFLAARVADVEEPKEVPRNAGAHPKGLDCEESALDYFDRCGDLWRGRPLLQKFVRGIWEHPIVRDDVSKHIEHVTTLGRSGLPAGEQARIEGQNAFLRSEQRLAATDKQVAEEVVAVVFKVS
jgi:tetratricopeptide (TPR) repeat protein